MINDLLERVAKAQTQFDKAKVELQDAQDALAVARARYKIGDVLKPVARQKGLHIICTRIVSRVYEGALQTVYYGVSINKDGEQTHNPFKYYDWDIE